MGEVWKGIDRRIRRKAAIKLTREEADPALVPEQVSRLGREATAAGRLAHPHIVAVYDYPPSRTCRRPRGEPVEEDADEAGAVEDEVLEGEYVDPDPSEVFSARIRAALVERGRLARAEDDPGLARLELGEVLTDTIGLFGSDDPLTVEFGFDLACACACARARDELFGEASALLGEIVPRMAALHGPEDRRTLYARHLLPWYLASAGAVREAAGLHADVVGDLRRVLGESDSLTLRTPTSTWPSWPRPVRTSPRSSCGAP